MMGVNHRIIDCGGKIRPNDLPPILTKFRPADFLILERVELLSETLVHVLTAPMESFTLDIVVGKGNAAKNVKLTLPVFTVVGLSSQPHQINKRLQKLFLFRYEFEPYNSSEISQLITMFVNEQGQTITSSAADLLVTYCKGTVNDAKALAKKVADYCLVKLRSYKVEIDYSDVVAALDHLGYFDKSNSPTQIKNFLCKITGIAFENFNADLFTKMGYTTEITQATGDHGIDLFLNRDNETIAVQCKRWDKPIGEPIIRDFYGALLNSGVAKGIVITTSTFTPQAYSFVDKKPIMLIDIDKLVELVQRYYTKTT